MPFSIPLLFALVSASAANGHAPKPPQSIVGPSFPCVGALTPTETLICGDSELRAYDRAISFAFNLKVHLKTYRNTQKEWLAKRDRCGFSRSCIVEAYKERVSDLQFEILGPSLDRIAAPPPDGSDLLLGTLMSPTKRVRPLGDEADLFIKALGENWYFFQASAKHYYDPHDGKGPDATTSSATGLMRMKGNKGVFVDDPDEPEGCTVTFQKFPRGKWKLEENGCSGIGSTLTGIYR